MTKTLMVLFLGLISAGSLLAQSNGSLRGVATDPSGARVTKATVVAVGADGKTQTTTTTADGSYSFPQLAAGDYTLNVTATGLALATPQAVTVTAGKATVQNLALSISVEQQQVTVSEQAAGLDTSPDNNAGAIVIKGKDLDALSDDPDELSDELNALAGPAAGPNGGQVYIDGFSGGQLPPKSSIREIRINQNPFSAEYDKLGYGRIEILTKPGTNKMHGMVMANGNDSAFNSLNPFVTSEPPYYSTFFLGNVSGSINSNASWFFSGFRRDNNANSIISAQLLDAATGGTYNYSAAVPNPQSRTDLSPRIDLQLTPSNTLTVRYMYDRQKSTNNGVSQFALQTQGYDTLNQENTLQLSDTQVLSAKVINETRFEYIRDRDDQNPLNGTPTITVQGAFTGGGSNLGTVLDAQDHYELQNYTTAALGAHSIRFGARLRAVRDSNSSTAGFNGNYTYASLGTYAAGAPSQYEVTVGTAAAKVTLFDAGVFFQDDWRVRKNFTFSYGLRYEGQNRISDHADWGPRFSFAWAVNGGNKPATTVIRGGYGWFFDRFQSTYVLQAIRQNGINQIQYVIKNPTPAEIAAPTSSSESEAAPTTYAIAPGLKAPINMQAALGIEHRFGKAITLSSTYINSRGVHQLYSDNINAFLPGTYDITTGTGVRPNGINENIYQFQSGGIYHQNQLITNFSVRARRVTMFGFYVLNFAKSDTSGATYFPSNQFDPKADYGRSTFDVRNRFLLGGNITAPYGISISPFLVVNSGTPFDITVGQDLNGDNQFNDRPAYATSSSTDVINTKYGNFDINPSAFEARIPYNSEYGPGQFSTNLRISKSIGIGPKMEGGSGGGFNGPPPGGGGGRGPGGGGPPGGGLGPGGLSSAGGRPPMFDQGSSRRYSLTFTAMGRNIFNDVNLAAPVGVLQSPLFGKSNALAGGFFSSPSSNRSIDLQMSFNF
jgi:hypothetical protein